LNCPAINSPTKSKKSATGTEIDAQQTVLGLFAHHTAHYPFRMKLLEDNNQNINTLINFTSSSIGDDFSSKTLVR
jgi:hypothetical protein